MAYRSRPLGSVNAGDTRLADVHEHGTKRPTAHGLSGLID
jgi:hypothetical protein